MLYVFNCLIQIGGLKLDFLSEVEIESSWKEMTDKATIKIPKRVYVRGADMVKSRIQDVIKTGDPVIIRLGYNAKLRTEFIGYVTHELAPGIPIEVNCEDEMWKLKRTRISNKVFGNAKLSDLVKYILPNHKVDILDCELGKNYSCLDEQESTVALALKKVEGVFGLKSFFRLVPDPTNELGVKQVLVIGKPYSSEDLADEKPVIFNLYENVKSNNLKYVFASSNPVQIKGICKVDSGKDLVFIYPKNVIDGAVKTIHFVGISQDQLEKNVKSYYAMKNSDRYTGEIISFGVPYTRHGLTTNIIDTLHDKRDVMHFIDSVTIKADINGFERRNTIGLVVNDTNKNIFITNE